jgi:hypothetical protein
MKFSFMIWPLALLLSASSAFAQTVPKVDSKTVGSTDVVASDVVIYKKSAASLELPPDIAVSSATDKTTAANFELLSW